MPVLLRAPHYQRRVVDDELDVLLAGLAAVALDGAKAVGKSATAAERVEEVFALEDPDVRAVLAAEPARVDRGVAVLIDEWQHLPVVWDVVRRAVDAGAPPGRFLFTGSANQLNPGTHSGAGRIVTVRMRPLALAERGVAEPTVSLRSLLDGTATTTGRSPVRLEQYVREIVLSGFPGIRRLPDRARRAQLDSYLQRVIDRDFADAGQPVRNPAGLRRWMTAYAAATSTAASFETVRDAASAGEGDKPAKKTTAAYRDTLERLFVVDPLPAWLPTTNHIRELAAAPKHQMADPALAVALLGLDERALLAGETRSVAVPRDGTFLGALFESLVVLSLRVYAQAAEATVSHFRAHRGDHEVDAIVERRDGRVLAIEAKLTGAVDDHDVRHLLWLRDQLGDDLLDAAIVTTGPEAYRRSDGIAVIPAALLGP